MAETTVLRGAVKFKETTLTESLTNRILSIASDGTITDRPGIPTGTFISTVLTSAQILVGNGSNVATAVAMSGDVTINNAGVTAIGAGVIVNADINNSAGIVYSKLSLTNSILNADIAAGAAIAYSKLNLATSIVNGDVAVAAAIARTKLASGNNYRILANNASGVMSENAALTATRAIGSDANGQLQVSTTTFTQLGYSDTLTGNIQTQLDNEIATRPVNAIVKAPGAGQDGFAITWNNGAGEYTLTDPVVQGIPVAGSARQFLGKNSGTDYDASWLTLLITDIPGITASAADLNVMQGANAANVTPTIIGYLGGGIPVTSSIQTQLNAKQSSSLAQNAMWVGNASGVAAQLSPGTDGYVLTSVSGAPQWQPGALGSISGLTTNRVPYATSSTTLGDDSAFTWDATNDALTVSTIRIHGTGAVGNTFVGEGSGNFTTTGSSFNAAIGRNSGAALTTGSQDTLIGASSGQALTSGSNNTFIGQAAAILATTGGSNISIGKDSAALLTTGGSNILIGTTSASNLTTGSNNIHIGTNGELPSATLSNQLNIQNAIYGSGNAGTGSTMSTGIVGLYSTAVAGSWQKATFIGNVGAESTAIANGIVMYAKDSSDGSANSTLALYTEQAPEATATFTQTHRVKVWWNNVEYWMSLDAV